MVPLGLYGGKEKDTLPCPKTWSTLKFTSSSVFIAELENYSAILYLLKCSSHLMLGGTEIVRGFN